MNPAPNTYDIGDKVVLTCTFTTSPTVGTIAESSNVLTLQDPAGYDIGSAVIIVGAGALGGNLTTTVQAISGSTATLANPALTGVRQASVGVLSDPTTVTCKVRLPDDSQVTVTNAKTSTGKYSGTYLPTIRGDHFVRWAGTGAAVGASERQFVVREERVT